MARMISRASAPLTSGFEITPVADEENPYLDLSEEDWCDADKLADQLLQLERDLSDAMVTDRPTDARMMRRAILVMAARLRSMGVTVH